MKINLGRAIEAKSDQLNADDLMRGPKTIRITDIKNGSKEQPVVIYYEGDNGKPWKPAKTVLRHVLFDIWGAEIEENGDADVSHWCGLSLTLYRDPNVNSPTGEKNAGGIRVSHMEGLTKMRRVTYTASRSRKATWEICPLIIERKTSAVDKIRDKLFAVAQSDDELTVEKAWGLLKPEQQEAVGQDVYKQALKMEEAREEHEENDPSAITDSLEKDLENF